MISSLMSRHILPVFCAAGAAALISSHAPLVIKAVANDWTPLTGAAVLGVISGIFYSATHDLLAAKTNLSIPLRYALAPSLLALRSPNGVVAAAAVGLIAMPSLSTLAALVSAAIAADHIFRAIFADPLPAKPAPQPVVKKATVPAPPQPQLHEAKGQPLPTLKSSRENLLNGRPLIWSS